MPRKVPKPGSASEKAPVAVDQESLGLERLLFFSDAVFAIAITILVLDIRLPAGEEAHTDAELLAQLLGNWHKYLAYIISFLVIGSFWISHHQKFRFIRRYDRNLLMLNLLLLMAIAFLPFPTSVISEYGFRAATIFYALTIIVSGLLSVALWWYATRHNRLIDPQLDPRRRRQEFVSPLMTVAFFILSIGIAYINNDLTRLSWLLIIPVSAYLGRKIPVV
jgi:TMEM175 potassium channel family protein